MRPFTPHAITLPPLGVVTPIGVAHFQATGKRSLLDVALKKAELIDRLFGPGRRVDVCGHQEIEPVLVRLYEATGDERWWKLAKFFVDTRGTEAGGRRKRGEFSQDHAPLFEQTEAVGQVPRATYFYSGAADVGRLTGDPRYHTALRRLWEDVVTRKLYLSGGIGSRHDNEGFGPAYELPSRTAYTEVCAAVSFPMWATRMFRVEPDARYFDVIERTLYNNYPCDGREKLVLNTETRSAKLETIFVRIPGWAGNEPVPGDLYRFANHAADVPTLAVNGQPVAWRNALTDGFARLPRDWRSGDVIELDLPMPVRRVIAHPDVQDCAGKVALQRGPIVYCFEGADYGGRVLDLAMAADAVFAPCRRDDLLGGTTVLEGELIRAGERIRATGIPYHLWSNRGAGEMTVWLKTLPAQALQEP